MTRKIVTRTSYEWDLQTTDEHGDIIDHDHRDTFPGIPTDPNISLVLVKDTGTGYHDDFDNTAMLDDRTWAYVVDGKLPTHFQDGSRVPKRFHKHFK